MLSLEISDVMCFCTRQHSRRNANIMGRNLPRATWFFLHMIEILWFLVSFEDPVDCASVNWVPFSNLLLRDSLWPQQDNPGLFRGGCIGHRASKAREDAGEIFWNGKSSPVVWNIKFSLVFFCHEGAEKELHNKDYSIQHISSSPRSPYKVQYFVDRSGKKGKKSRVHYFFGLNVI